MASASVRVRGILSPWAPTVLGVVALFAACFSPSGSDVTATGSTTGDPGTTGPGTTVEPPSGTTTSGDTTTTTTQPTTGTTTGGDTTTGTEGATSLVTTGLTLTGLTTGLTEATGLTATTLLETTTMDTTSGSTTNERGLCGDGLIDDGEACDDGNPISDDGCSADCQLEFRYVFVSSAIYPGASLGGVEDGDEACNLLASAQQPKLAGRTFVAWLSDDTVSAAERIGWSDLEYRLTDAATVIASDTAELLDGTLDAPIDLVETGLPAINNNDVWTGTLHTGVKATNHCSEWSGGMSGMQGSFSATDIAWTQKADGMCFALARIYCFEKGE